MSTLTCGRCGKSAETTKQGTLEVFPSDWVSLALAFKPIVHQWLCGGCAEAVRAFATDYGLVLADRFPPAAGVTDEMVVAFGRAWKGTPEGEPGARRRAGLEAALAVMPR